MLCTDCPCPSYSFTQQDSHFVHFKTSGLLIGGSDHNHQSPKYKVLASSLGIPLPLPAPLFFFPPALCQGGERETWGRGRPGGEANKVLQRTQIQLIVLCTETILILLY